jgi:cytoskeletal protein CcmA (bactofilin family)
MKEDSQGKKNDNTPQLDFSSTKMIVDQAKQSGKELGEVFTLRDKVTTTKANLTLALVQVIGDLEGRVNLKSRVNLGNRATIKGKANP